MDFISFQNNLLKYLSKKCRNQNYQNSLRTKNKSPNTELNHSAKATENDLNFFKSVVVVPTSMELIKQKLKLTAELRAKKVKEIKLDFLEQYPIFYTHPILVKQLKCLLKLE